MNVALPMALYKYVYDYDYDKVVRGSHQLFVNTRTCFAAAYEKPTEMAYCSQSESQGPSL